MPLHCPACGGVVRAEYVNVGLNDATCPHCQEPFRPSCALPPADQDSSVPPPGSFSINHMPDGGVRIHIAPAGLTGMTLGLLGFALFWNLILIGVFAGFLRGMVKGEVDWTVLSFFLPFFIIGMVTPYAGCRLAWTRTTLWLDRDGFAALRVLFGHRRGHAFPLDQIEGFSREVSYRQNNKPVYACRARVGRTKISFGRHLSEDDQERLVGQLNRTLTDVRG